MSDVGICTVCSGIGGYHHEGCGYFKIILGRDISKLNKAIAELDDNNPKNWDLIAAMSRSLVEKEKKLADEKL